MGSQDVVNSISPLSFVMLVCVDLHIKGLVWDIVDIRLDVRLKGLKTQGREMIESGWMDISMVKYSSDPVTKNKFL